MKKYINMLVTPGEKPQYFLKKVEAKYRVKRNLKVWLVPATRAFSAKVQGTYEE